MEGPEKWQGEYASEKVFAFDFDPRFERFLAKGGYRVDTAPDYDRAVALLGGEDYDVILADINLMGERTGIDLLKEIRRRNIHTPVVIITGFPGVDTASEAVRHGAFDYLCKPVEKDTLLRVARTAARHKALGDEIGNYRRNLEAVFRSVRDAMITVDRDLTITGLNEAAHGICVFSRDAVGKPLRPAAEACGGECLRAVEETLETKQPIDRYKFECSRGEGKIVLTMNVSPLLDHQGKSTGAVIVIRDETRLDSLERDLKKRVHFHNRIIGKSESMQKIYSLIEDLADVQTTVLISGESGTGKELVAEALHYTGRRKDRPLVKVNCSALSESLLESELFGHVKGAFTGAVNDKKGRFEIASGGTIFLDEIGDLSPNIQQKLLRVLQGKEFERVGDSTPVKVDVRIVAATNRDLKAMAAQGEFREDLLYRLRVVEIKVPSFRERMEDIPLLVEFFLSEFNREFNKKIESLSSDVMRIFMDYRWPGNVRELRHALEHACVLCKKPTITTEDLPAEFRELWETKPSLPADLTTDEASVFLQALKDAKWNKTEVARLLGMSRQTLYRKLKALGIED